MRKSRWLFLAMMVTVMAAVGQSSSASGSGASRVPFCPALPADCWSHFTVTNGCLVCTKAGC